MIKLHEPALRIWILLTLAAAPAAALADDYRCEAQGPFDRYQPLDVLR